MNALALKTLLAGYRLRCDEETVLHEAIAQCLVMNKIEFQHEVRLKDSDRLDFMVWQPSPCCGQFRCIHGELRGIAIEVKIDGAVSALIRQVHRYAQHDCVSEILIVTTRASHMSLSCRQINSKPVCVCWIGGQSL